MQQILDPKGNLVWTRTGEAVEASVVDHLGTIRRFSDGAGQGQSAHSCYPFGVEQTTSTDGERLKFTGQERDTWNTSSTADDLDYFHARHYNPQLGRFLQMDPLLGSVNRPQSLNRYAYVLGNPLSFTDPFGLEPPECVNGMLRGGGHDGEPCYDGGGETHGKWSGPVLVGARFDDLSGEPNPASAAGAAHGSTNHTPWAGQIHRQPMIRRRMTQGASR